MKYFIWAFLCALGCMTGQLAQAQETSSGLRGLAGDATNHPLAGVTVTAIHTASGTRYSAVTGADGRYNLPGLRVGGPYTLEVTFTGMNTETRSIPQITLGETLTLNFTLTEKSEVLTDVVVKARRSSPKANSYGTGMNISRDDIRQ